MNVVLGLWLFLSGFVWRHSATQQAISWITGLAITIVALIALKRPTVRFVNLVLGIWLVVSALSLPHLRDATLSNNAIVGLIVFLVARIGPDERSTRFGGPARSPN